MPDNDTQKKDKTQQRSSTSADGNGYTSGSGIPSTQGPDLSSVNSHVRVTAKPGESAESLLRRFRQEVKDSGLMERMEKLRFYEKPSQKKKEEEQARLKKIARAQKFNR